MAATTSQKSLITAKKKNLITASQKSADTADQKSLSTKNRLAARRITASSMKSVIKLKKSEMWNQLLSLWMGDAMIRESVRSVTSFQERMRSLPVERMVVLVRRSPSALWFLSG